MEERERDAKDTNDTKDAEPRKLVEPPPEATSGGGALSGAQFAGIGIQFALSILLGLYAGRWLDGRLGTPPVFLMIGVFVGAAAGFFSMYRAAMRPPKS